MLLMELTDTDESDHKTKSPLAFHGEKQRGLQPKNLTFQKFFQLDTNFTNPFADCLL